MKTRPTWRRAATGIAFAAALGVAPASAQSEINKDLDGDGIINALDPDIDNDAIPNGADRNVDGGKCKKGKFKGRYIGDRLRNDDPRELDIDDDGLPDDSARELDIDGDRRKDDATNEKDIDGDGRGDDHPNETDIDGDGNDDSLDEDIDGDGRGNSDDDDCDGDEKSRGRDDDDDGDGSRDENDDDDDNDGVSDDESEVETSLQPTADAPAGSRVRTKIKQLPSGKIELDFDARNLAVGEYDVVIDGQNLGTLVIEPDGDRTEGEIEFETNPNEPGELLLPFDPVGLSVEISLDGVVYFTGTVPTPPTTTGNGDGDDDDDGGPVTPLTSSLTPADGLSGEAEASVEVKYNLLGVVEAEIEVEGIPAGDYDFMVAGIQRGTLVVVSEKRKLRGKLKFEKTPGDGDELLLDFDIAGQTVEISQEGDVFFSGTAPIVE